MLKFLLSIVILLTFNLLNTKGATYYVNQNTPSSAPDGSYANPYTSIAAAVTALGAVTCDLLLLGTSVTISSAINIPAGGSYSIAPDPSYTASTYFPMYLSTGSTFTHTSVNITFTGIEFVEQLTARATSLPVIAATRGNVTLNRVLLQNIKYTGTYLFAKLTGNNLGYSFKVLNSNFDTLNNSEFAISGAQMFVYNCNFTNMNNYGNPFVIVSGYTGPGGSLSFIRTRWENIIIGQGAGFGLIGALTSRLSIYINYADITNVTCINQYGFFNMGTGTASTADTATDITYVSLKNINIKDYYEAPTVPITLTTKGLFVSASSPSQLRMENITVSNFVAARFGFVSFLPMTNNFYSTFAVLNSASIKNVYIENSYNPYIRTFILDTLVVSNVTYVNIGYSNITAVENGLLYVSTSHSATFTDIKVSNSFGPIFTSTDVLWLQYTNVDIENHTTSSSFTGGTQSITSISKSKTAAAMSLNASKPLGVGFQSFNVNGFDSQVYIDNPESSNMYIVSLSFNYGGDAYINNSIWNNIHLLGLGSTTLSNLKMSNMTFSDDHSKAISAVTANRFIELININQADFTDLTFINNQRTSIFRHSNMRRSDLYDSVNVTVFNFNNIQILGNTGDYYTSNTRYYSFFVFYNPNKYSQITFTNCTFEDNTIYSSLIYAVESYWVNLTIANSTFHNNTATQSGVVLSSSNMKYTQSLLSFTNNTITNNYCSQNGAVFYFTVASFQTISSNNVYMNNKAGGSGGVGYFFSSDANFVETGSTYFDNSAVTYGGNWYINIKAMASNVLAMSFLETTFENSFAYQKGGAFYLEAGVLTLDGCSFTNSKATAAGADVYVVSADSVTITGTNFTKSSSADGIVLYGEDATDAIFTITNIQVDNIAYNNSKAEVINMNYGTVNITGSTFSNIAAGLLTCTNMAGTLTGLTISQITCSASTGGSCLIASSASTIAFSDSTITDITSNVDIMDFKSTTTIALSKLTISNLKNTITKATQLFIIGAYKVTAFSLDSSELTQSEFSGLNSTSSVVSISDTTFSNKPARRLLTSRTLATTSIQSLLQFLYLVSSSSVITGSNFIENNPTAIATTIQGGAIRILGTGGTHVISGSTFEANQAVSGGAISVEGSANSFSIDTSYFISNSATNYGGGMVIANETVALTPAITNSFFEYNKAKFGGALYVGNQKLTISNTLFLANSATSEGGAIGSIAKSVNTMTITNSNFTQNTAVQGPALMAFGDMVFTYPSTTFLQNVATYGSDISGKPSQLRLRVFEVSPLYLLSTETNINQMLNYGTTVLIYDSISSTIRETLYQPTGLSPNYLFEFSFVNTFDDTIQNLSDMVVTVSLGDADSAEDTSKLGLIGTPSLTADGSISYMFNSFAVRGVVGSTFNTSATGTYLNLATGLTETLSSLVWNMTITSCSVGEIYDSSANTCGTCSSGTYSFTDPTKAKVCNSCLDNAVCLGADALYPEPGYWRIDKYSENIIECPNAAACLGGQLDPNNIANISYTGVCDPKYEGVACSSCSEGRAKFGSNSSCIDCKSSALYYLMFVGYFIIELGMVIFTVRSSLNEGKAKNAHKSKKEALQSALMKILIDFIQIITLTSDFSFRWPFNMGTALKVFSKFVPTNTDSLSVDCFIALGKGNNKEIFFNKVLILGAEPFLCVIVGWMVWAYVFKRRKLPRKNNPEFKNKLIMTTVIIMYMLQPGVVKVMFQLFNCQNFGTEAEPEYYMVNDTNIKCMSAQHLRWSLGIGVPCLFLGLVVPIALLAYAAKSKKLQANEEFKLRYSFMFKIYRDGFFGWELVIMSRKVLIIIISVFITSTYLQAYLCTIILLAQFQMEFRVNPYFDKNLNTFEALSLFASTFIMYSGLYFVRSYTTTRSIIVAYILLLLDLIVGSSVILYSLYVFRRVFRQQTNDMKNRLQKFIERANTTGKSSFLTRKLAQTGHSLLVALTPRNSSGEDSSSNGSDSSREYKGSENPFSHSNTHNLQIVSSDDLLSPKSSSQNPLHIDNILNFESPLGKSANISRFGREFSPRGSPPKNLSPGKNLSNFFPNPEFSISKASSLVFEPGSPKARKDESLAEENVDADETSMRMDIPSPYIGLKERPKPLQSISHHHFKNYDQESWNPMCDESEQASVRKLISPRESFLQSPSGTPRNLKLLSNRDSSWNGDLSIDSTRIMKKLIAFSPHDSMIQTPSVRKNSPRDASTSRKSDRENSILRKSPREDSVSKSDKDKTE